MDQIRELAHRLADIAPVVVLLLDPDGRIAYCNPEFERLTGSRFEDVQGADWVHTFIPTRQRDDISALHQRVAAGEVVRGHVNPVLARDRGEVDVEWHNRPMSDIAGRPAGVLSIGIDVTTRERARRDLALVRHALDQIDDGAYVADEQGRIVFANMGAARMLGHPLTDLLDLGVTDIDGNLTTAAGWESTLRTLRRRPRIKVASQHVRSDGTRVAVDVSASFFAFEGRDYVLGLARDMSERDEQLHQLRVGVQRYRSVVDTTPDGFWVIDMNGQIVEVNAVYCEWSGYHPEELHGRHVEVVEAAASPAHSTTAPMTPDDHRRFETSHRRKDGTLWPVEVSVSVNRELGQRFVFVRDLSHIKAVEAERTAAEQAMRHMAFHDALTQLPNRRLLTDRLRQAIATLDRRGGHAGLLFVDLDGFKAVNDRFGHDGGDALLVEIARRLRTAVRAEDTVARIGGDEFVVIATTLPGAPADALAALAEVASKIAAAIAAPMDLGGQSLSCGASIGRSLFRHGDDVDLALSRADAAMYVDKLARKRAADPEIADAG